MLRSDRGSGNIGVDYDVGLRLPTSCTATGKTLLATQCDEVVHRLLGDQSFKRRIENSHQSVDALVADLGVIRVRGYSIDDEETSLGMCCIGVAPESPNRLAGRALHG
jgi:DNA-binding IclR family transcriptional regulator